MLYTSVRSYSRPDACCSALHSNVLTQAAAGSVFPALAGKAHDKAILTLCRMLRKGDAMSELKTEAEPAEVGLDPAG